MGITTDRLSSLIQREVAVIINNVIKNPTVGYINITEVKVTKDLSYATIFYTVLSDEKETIELAASVIEEKKIAIRMELAKKIRNIRKIPDLIFKYDEALAYGNKIDSILKSIK
ncbi:Ribosome-binding factor A [Alteracholeplasma palmae J233]|uniref:Ribosome-binding factor A n=1 Tax=Alteracholeplasma palmae (strain ATCC 49389 / J233) TaxID=1318466 RepID=U4KKC6_ALTPJ|nr:30S ribosome-binding factor RbfA [Alteracholeplasma palmae]CCV64032.1 Ribosome-binding factor A [Alteracholeplasma palmae J233]